MRCTLCCLLVVVACAAPRPTTTPSAAARPRYTMDVTLTPASHELRVTGSVVVPLTGADTTFALMAAAADVQLSSEPAGTFAAAPARNDVVERTLHLAAPAREVTIRFAYAIRTETTFVYHIGEDAMLAGGPNQAWYPQLELKGTAEVQYHYPSRYRMVTGTRLQDQDSAGTRTTRASYTQPSTFSFVAAPLIARARRGAVPVHAMVTRERAELPAYLDGCARILDVLSREFGAYPYDSFTLVELPDAVTEAAGFWGASFDGFMIASSSNLDAPFNLAYFGHELGHQWWGNDVTLRGSEGGMLTNEGLAQYGSLRAVEELASPAAAEAYRRRGYPGYNDDQSGLGYLRYAAAGLDVPVAAAVDNNGGLHHQLANSKGLLALDQLSRVVGRDRFRAALHEVTQTYAFRAMAWSDFRAIVERHAARPLAAVFAQWFDRPGAPDLAVEWAPGATRGVIVQRGEPYQLDVEIALLGAREQRVQTVAIREARTAFALAAPFAIQRVELDPHYKILRWTPELRAEAEAFVDCTRAFARRAEGDADGAAAQFTTALTRVPADDRFGVRFLAELGLGRTLQRRGDLAGAKTHFAAALAAPVRPPDRVARVYLYLTEIAAQERDTAAAQRYGAAAVEAEAASGQGLGIAAAVRPLLARALEK